MPRPSRRATLPPPLVDSSEASSIHIARHRHLEPRVRFRDISSVAAVPVVTNFRVGGDASDRPPRRTPPAPSALENTIKLHNSRPSVLQFAYTGASVHFPRAYDDVQYLPPVLAPFVLPTRGALRDPAMADHVHAQREHYYHAVLLHEFD